MALAIGTSLDHMHYIISLLSIFCFNKLECQSYVFLCGIASQTDRQLVGRMVK